MDDLWLSEAQAKQLIKFAVDDAPHETCGLIMGRGIRAEQIVPITNIAEDSEHFFQLDPHQMARGSVNARLRWSYWQVGMAR